MRGDPPAPGVPESEENAKGQGGHEIEVDIKTQTRPSIHPFKPKIFEEENVRQDGENMRFLSVKIPWYGEKDITVGVMGASIVIGKHSLADAIAKLTSIGLLSQSKFNQETPLHLKKIKVIVSELAYNIIKYATKGFIRISQLEERGKRGVVIKATDKGPGIDDIDKALQDNYSTSGTLGLGLPGIKRMADELKVNSSIDKGTEVIVKYFINE